MVEHRQELRRSLPDDPVEGKADLHIHSAVGDALPTPQEILDYVAEHTDLAVIAITDHDDVQGGLQAREIAAQRQYPFEVVVGTEVTTLAGHLLALFVEERLPMFQSLERTIETVHRQGGLCIAPHPMSWLTFSIGEVLLRRYSRHRSPELCLDGLEGFNPSVAGWVCHKRVRALNAKVLGLPELGGSDAHQLLQIGTAYTLFGGHSAADLRRALLRRETIPCGSFWSASFHLQGAAEQSWKSLVIHPGQKLCRAIGARLGAPRSSSL